MIQPNPQPQIQEPELLNTIHSEHVQPEKKEEVKIKRKKTCNHY
jgi:hypothetical protein